MFILSDSHREQLHLYINDVSNVFRIASTYPNIRNCFLIKTKEQSTHAGEKGSKSKNDQKPVRTVKKLL